MPSRKQLSHLSVLLPVLLLFTLSARPQVINISGHYLDKKQQPIDSALVSFTRYGTELGTAFTDASGYYSLDVVLTGQKEVHHTEPGLHIYPNPYTSQLNIRAITKQAGVFQVIDLQGRVQASRELSSGGTYLLNFYGAMSGPGVYLAVLRTAQDITVLKMIQAREGNGQLSLLSWHTKPVKSYHQANAIDTLHFIKQNTSALSIAFSLSGDTVINQTGNPGPYRKHPLNDTSLFIGDSLNLDLNLWYGNDEVNQYSASYGTLSDSVLTVPVDTSVRQIQLFVSDATDPLLSLSDSFTLYGNLPPLPPVAMNDTFLIAEDSIAFLDLLANDLDPNANLDPVSLQIISPPNHASVSVDSLLVRFEPALNYFGPDSFTYRISDSTGLSDTASTLVMISPENDPPILTLPSRTVPEDQPTPYTLVADLDSHAIDVEGDSLSYSILSQNNTTLAQISITINSLYISYLQANGSGTCITTVVASDGMGGMDTAYLVLTVLAVNDAPVAVDDNLQVNEDSQGSINVLLNDNDIDNSFSLTNIVTNPSNGQIISTVNGVVVYEPTPDFNGFDVFEYEITDVGGLKDTAAVFVNVLPVNDAPEINIAGQQIQEDEATPYTMILNLDSVATDKEGDNLSYNVIGQTNPTLVNASVNGKELQVNYLQPNGNGNSNVGVKVTDGNGGADTAYFTITVIPVNDKPTANNDVGNTNQGTPVTIDVIANDNDNLDPNGAVDPSSVTIVSNPNNGNTNVNSTTGEITYTPTPTFTGTDTLEYSIADNGNPALKDTAEVVINVAALAQIYFQIKDIMADTLLKNATLIIGTNQYTLSNGDTTMTVTPGVKEVNATHPGSIDYWIPQLYEEYLAIQRPGQFDNVEQRSRNDYTSPVTFGTNNDTLTLYKIMNDVPLLNLSIAIGTGAQGQTIRFGQQSPEAWLNLNFMTPANHTDSLIQEAIYNHIPEASLGKLTMQYTQDTIAPSQPYLELKFDYGIPPTNGTLWNLSTFEITDCSARGPPSTSGQSVYTEIIQAVQNQIDVGISLVTFNSSTSTYELSTFGKQCLRLGYNFDAGTKF